MSTSRFNPYRYRSLICTLIIIILKQLAFVNARPFNCDWIYPTIDIRGMSGVKVNKITGSRVEYIPFPMDHKIEPGHNFSFEFKTRSADGLVFVTGNFEHSALVSAFLVNGTIIFARRCGRGTVFEPHSNITWNDGKWHKMAFTLNSFGGDLEIDEIKEDNDEGIKVFISKNHIDPCGNFNSLVFGGLSKKIYDDNRETFEALPSSSVDDYEAPEIVKHRFSGCIRNLNFDSSFPTIPPKYYGVSQC